MSFDPLNNSRTLSKDNHFVENDLKINRWVCLILYSIISFSVTYIHSGFGGWQLIIYKTGAYSELCKDGDEVQIISVNDDLYYKSCGVRDENINNLLTLAFFSQYIIASISGFILDKFGEKICFLCGQLILVLAFFLLAIIKSSFGWVVFFFLIGASSELCFYPLLKLSKFFPGKESLIMGILGSARSIGFSVGLLLKILFFSFFGFKDNEFYIICILYICTFILFAILIGIFVVPHNNNNKVTPKINSNGTPDSFNHSKNEKEDAINDLNLLENQKQNNKKKTQMKETLNTLWKHPKKTEYIIMVFICISNLLRFDFYVKSNRTYFIWGNHNLITLFSIFTILSFIPTPFFGHLADKFGSITGLCINNTFAFLSYIFVIFNSVYLKILSIIFFFFFISFLLSGFYCYIEECYPKKSFGKLIGIKFAISSLFLIINFYLTHLTNVEFSHLNDRKHVPVTIGYIILGFISLMANIYVLINQKKK